MGNRITEREKIQKLKTIPWCSAALTAINILVFLLCHIWGDFFYNQGSFSVAYLLRRGDYYRLITAMFLHVSIGHLVNNMILLFFAGELVEKTIGRVRFLILFFFSGVIGNLLSGVFEIVTGSYYDSVGASGAVFGIIGGLLYLVIARKGHGAGISMQRMVLMVAFSLYSGFKDPMVNNAAHLGGLLSGCLITFLLCHIGKIPGTVSGRDQ